VKKIRETRGEITLFKSVGAAVHDLAAADRAPAGAQRLGLCVERWL
jgi:ornithine cyclodeaminase/alanine dehydrogenase-like protein (mu-crystallin family)